MVGFIPALEEHTMTTAYCLKCKRKVEIKNPREVILKNNKHALLKTNRHGVHGVCSVCGTKVFRPGKV
ncbi:hypothetical protein ES703_86310 [subsurface metagenome]